MSATDFSDVSLPAVDGDVVWGRVGESSIDMGDRLPTGTVTLLLADIEGSTSLWQSHPDTMADALYLMNRTADKLIATHHGVRPVEQGEGDSFVAGFARASDAVACALRLQLTDLSPIKLRIGLHTGEVQLRDEGNYAGTTINKAARLRDLGHGGQTIMSGATEELVEDNLPDGAWLSDLGSHALRGISRPVRVSQLCHPDLPASFPPLRTSEGSVAQNLPTQLTSFVGRQPQVTDLRNILSDARLVTLTGAGGSGKTRLAIEVAGHVAEQFSDGISYVDLAPISHPDVVPVAVARALGLPDQPGRSTIDAVLGHVRSRNMLLVLDNCEHLLDASAALTTELLARSSVTVLATSREPLLVPGETTWQVPSLTLADEAIELFTDRARRARAGFRVDDDNIHTVTEICRRLDGMPLAIELAAARVRALSLTEILDSLHDRFRLLTGGARTAVRRQQTLRASVDWSHALLTKSERVLFRRLAVFMGGFRLDAAHAVAGEADVERYQMLDQLSLLVDKSLVVADDTGSATRYRLLETVRQYALEKLGESGESEAVRARQRDHYAALAELLDAHVDGRLNPLVDQAESEIDNLRAAFAWSLEIGDTTTALEIATSLQPLWLMRGRVLEGAAWLDAALSAQEEGTANVAAVLEAKALADTAMLSNWVGFPDALGRAERALSIARDMGDPALLARALTACGSVSALDYEVARGFFSEAGALAREVGDFWRLNQIFGRQTYSTFVAGDLVETEKIAREGIQAADALGDYFGSGQCRWALIGVYMHRGDVVPAIGMLKEFIADATRCHDQMAKVTATFLLAFALAFHGDAKAARAAGEAAASESSGLIGLFDQATYSAIAIACLADGDLQAAWRAAQTAEERGITPAVDGLNMAWISLAALGNGELDVAQRWVDHAASIAQGYWRASTSSVRARILVAKGDTTGATEEAYEALAMAGAGGAHLYTPDTLECFAGLLFRSEREREATRLLGAAYSIRERLQLVRFPMYDGEHQALVQSLRDTLGESDFHTAWTEGARLSSDDAIAYALRGRGERKRPATGWDSLTPTELDVVRLVSEGMSNKLIAEQLFISPRTVQSHLRHVYNKLGLASRVHLAQEAVRRR